MPRFYSLRSKGIRVAVASGLAICRRWVLKRHLVFEVHVQNQFKLPCNLLEQRQFAEAQSFAFAEDHGSGTWHLNDGCRRFEAELISNALTMLHGWKWVLKCCTFVKLLESAV